MTLEQKLPYAFSKRFGVIGVTNAMSGPNLLLRSDCSTEAVAEAQRLLGVAGSLQVLSDAEFNRLLSQQHESDNDATLIEAEKLGEAMDLDDVARELAEPEDLLEADDDAPIIRLINALITEAIKENASDIHGSTTNL